MTPVRIFSGVVALAVSLAMTNPFAFAQENIKEAKLAGSWYPGTRPELDRMLDAFFAAVGDQGMAPDEDIGVIVSPHAGYPFSGPVAAYGFKAVRTKKISTVIILAPTHHFAFQGAAIWPQGAFATPLGTVAVDKELADKVLAADKLFSFRGDIFEGNRASPRIRSRPRSLLSRRLSPRRKYCPSSWGIRRIPG